MKKIILFVCLFSSFLTFSQQITIDRGKYYVKGKQISSFETKKLLASNQQAIALFKEAKAKEALGGFLIGIGVGLTVADLAMGVLSDKKYPSGLTYAGLGSIAISIPVLSGRRKKITEAIAIYNKDKNALGSTFHFNAISNQNGFGFQIKF
jgi:hypothetical protein